MPHPKNQTTAQAVKITVQLMGRRANGRGGAPVHARKGLDSENGLVALVLYAMTVNNPTCAEGCAPRVQRAHLSTMFELAKNETGASGMEARRVKTRGLSRGLIHDSPTPLAGRRTAAKSAKSKNHLKTANCLFAP